MTGMLLLIAYELALCAVIGTVILLVPYGYLLAQRMIPTRRVLPVQPSRLAVKVSTVIEPTIQPSDKNDDHQHELSALALPTNPPVHAVNRPTAIRSGRFRWLGPVVAGILVSVLLSWETIARRQRSTP